MYSAFTTDKRGNEIPHKGVRAMKTLAGKSEMELLGRYFV